ncbi:hypothetical protein CNECB9_2540011 [Cupriavidus necator]|uniref:Uncharacterized protein n=1 Tax=Cupriavidus necator TaxID=106590 RepID=A0A1K0IEL7_CUPNE|nr:hypothetical protein CNECB9_2540011 [Cupriavidus necator]
MHFGRHMHREVTSWAAADWLLRSQHNRTLPGGGKLWDRVTAGEPVGRIHFTLAARQAQPARGTAAGVGATCCVA